MQDFKRGFKTWCEKTASGLRRDLSLHAFAPLSPRSLAAHLRIKVLKPIDIPDLGLPALRQLTEVDSRSWSAVTILRRGKRIVILNSTSAEPRQTSSLMHEMAHVILNHEPARIDVSPDGLMLMDNYDPSQEAEADWLSAALLLPREALLQQLRAGNTIDQAASFFGVSVELARMRRDRTGIARQLSFASA